MRISKEQFEGLDKYKYSSVDKSILSRRVLTPWWNWLITLFPYTLAPNAVSCFAEHTVLAIMRSLEESGCHCRAPQVTRHAFAHNHGPDLARRV